jgi:IS605 OrfB family transposase
MIRKSTINLNSSNSRKLETLDKIFKEYNRVVNFIIQHLWDNNIFHGNFVKDIPDSQTWFSQRLQQCAAKQALSIVKSQRKRKHKTMPQFNRFSIELDSRFCEINQDLNSFSIWIKLSSIGDKLKLWLPSQKHRQFDKFKDWTLKKSIRLRMVDNNFFCDVYFEKSEPDKKQDGKEQSFDIGYKKLLVDNDGNKYGQNFEEICEKISRKEQGSKSFKRSLKERDEYINKVVKDIDLTETKVVYLEDLKNVKHNSKIGRKFMNKLQRWSYSRVIDRFKLICEETGVQLEQVNPINTSRTCVNCGAIHTESRKGEEFKCIECGWSSDADHVGALNILIRGQGKMVSDFAKVKTI